MAETTDDLVISFLHEAGVELPDGLASLGALDDATLVSACAHCLNVIMETRGEAQRFPRKLSPNPGARFRACTALSGAITALGLPGEAIGFNHLLYPSEAESRRILLFLVDQMPKGEGKGDEAEALSGGKASLDEQARLALQTALRVPWMPLAWQTHRRPLREDRASHLRRALAKAALAAARRAERQAAKEARLQSLAGAGGPVKQSGGFGEAPPGWVDGVGGAFVQPAGRAVPFSRTSAFAHDDADAAAALPADGSDETPIQRLERAEREKLVAVRGELEQVFSAIEEQRELAEAAEAAAAAVATAARQLEGEASQAAVEQDRREKANAVRKRALELAADPEGSRVRLQKAVAQSAAALMTLAEEWEAHRAPLLSQIRTAQRARQLRKEGAVAKMGQVKQLRVEMRGMVGELQSRDETTTKLKAELSKAKGAPRDSYTDRILDVVRNLRKQKAAIEQILSDIRGSQKEVNALSQTLQRSFSAADEIIFRDAVKSTASSKCYKALARMHEAFGNLVEHAQSIANAAATTAELGGKIGELTAQKTPEAIERVSADLKVIKSENAKLTAVAASG